MGTASSAPASWSSKVQLGGDLGKKVAPCLDKAIFSISVQIRIRKPKNRERIALQHMLVVAPWRVLRLALTHVSTEFQYWVQGGQGVLVNRPMTLCYKTWAAWQRGIPEAVAGRGSLAAGLTFAAGVDAASQAPGALSASATLHAWPEALRHCCQHASWDAACPVPWWKSASVPAHACTST